MAVRTLVLHARDPGHEIEASALVEWLQQLGLMGEPVPDQAGAYQAGEEFLSLITFLGCSPHIDLVPVDEAARAQGRYCHVRLLGPLSEVQFRAGPGPLQPRCAHCRQAVSDWQVEVETFLAQGAGERVCVKCGARNSIATLNWRQAAGFGRWFVEVWNIHPHEAVPSEPLLHRLEQQLGTTLSFFYE